MDDKFVKLVLESLLQQARQFQQWIDENLFPDYRGKTWLLFSFVTSRAGWDTGIAISNISLSPLGLTKPQQGRAQLQFYGHEAPPSVCTTPIPPGRVFTTLLSSIAAVEFEGYLIAECDFYPARGLATIVRLGGTDPSTYAAELFHVEPPRKSFAQQQGQSSKPEEGLGESTGLPSVFG